MKRIKLIVYLYINLTESLGFTELRKQQKGSRP